MNRPYTLALVLLALPAVAQYERAHTLARNGVARLQRPTAVAWNTSTEQARGPSYYTEDFDAGLNGWTVTTPVGTVDWKWTDAGPGPTTSLYPVPPLTTSTPTGWVIVDDDFEGLSGQPTETSLVSPIIDLSAAPTPLKLEFDQYFQEFNNDTTYVGVSTDGGSNWNEVRINDGVGRVGRPNPEVVELNIAPLINGGNQANVQLRFRYTSEWDYGWQVDNIRIIDLPDNDLALQESFLSQADLTYDDLDGRNLEYSFLPLEQVDDLVVGAMVRNIGAATQTNITLQAEVFVDGSSAGTYTSGSMGQLNTNEADSFFFNTGWSATAAGRVRVAVNVTADAADDDPSDNASERRVRVTDINNEFSSWGQDGNSASNTYYPIGTNQTSKAIGHKFEPVANGSEAFGVGVGLLEGTTVGSLINVELWRDDGTNLEQIALSELFEIQSHHLNGDGDSIIVNIPFDADLSTEPVPVVIDTDFDYIAFVHNPATDTIRLATSGPMGRGGLWGINSSDDGLVQYIGEGNAAAMVRLYLANMPVGISEAVVGDITLGSPAPNPAIDRTRIPYTVNNGERITLAVTDAMGKQVFTQDLGIQQTGPNSIELDVTRWASGSYVFTLTGERTWRSGQLTVAH
ncbi:MAG: T9SS type A sorting domain-containing protein [Flavobacteriales bacterium]|nr:T9SS type A sorting domain-containing protein [Flavobacteriales bacterium]MBP6696480.1 T9SS type A sorting domain-containing protein [Flavobacteriales bacterium]